jgi:hypothetical protein
MTANPLKSPTTAGPLIALVIVILIGLLIAIQIAFHSSVHFLITADPQFGAANKDDTDYTFKWNSRSRQTLRVMAGKTLRHRGIRGIIVAGDLTNNSLPFGQYDLYKSSLNPVETRRGKLNGLSFTYDGIGNHDMARPPSVDKAVGNEIACVEHSTKCISSGLIRHELATRLRDTAPFMRQGIHYAWKWGDVTFVHLNLFPGDTNGSHGDLSPDKSLTFLQTVIQGLNNDKDRLVIIHHFTFNKFAKVSPEAPDSDYWWTEEQMESYWDAIAKANVIGIFTGHSHRKATTSPRNDFLRPVNSTSGPDVIPAFVAGSAGIGLYLDVKISKSSMLIRPIEVTSQSKSNIGQIIKIPLA